MLYQFYLQGMLPAIPVLIAASLVIIIGYVGRAAFSKTKIPEALILILIGVLLVPVGHLLPSVYVSELRSAAPLFGDLALIVIMYNGGRIIGLNIGLLKGTKGLALGIIDVAFSSLFISAIMGYIFGWPLIYGALLGALLGETTTTIVVSVIKRIEMPPQIYQTLLLETTFNSVIAIMVFTMLLSFVSGQQLTASSSIEYIVDYISVAVALGAIAGLTWLAIQEKISTARGYLPTIATAILLYGATSTFNGAAPIAVLVFAIILGNYKVVGRYVGIEFIVGRGEARDMHAVAGVIEFLITTFFFVFIGIIASVSAQYFEYGLIITALLAAGRYAEMKWAFGGQDSKYSGMAFSLMPRGTTAAVLSSSLLSLGTGYGYEAFYISLIVIVLTNVVAGLSLSRARSIKIMDGSTAPQAAGVST